MEKQAVSLYQKQQKALIKQIEESVAHRSYQATVVDMQSDYEEDQQYCLTSLVFIPNQIAQKITHEIIDELKQIEPNHYFYPLNSMHITIKNIKMTKNPPSFTERDIDKVNKLFDEIIPTHSAFDFSLEDIVRFPSSLSVMAYADQKFQKLVLALDQGLKEIRVPDDKKYFSNEIFFGNVSFCRFTQKPSKQFIERVKEMRHLKIGAFKVEKIHLVSCNAVCAEKTRKIRGEYCLK